MSDGPPARRNCAPATPLRNTALDLKFETGALESYRDFINAIQGAKPGSPEAIKVISGSATWDGKIAGPPNDITFTGHVRGERARYETATFDLIEGDLVYSPDKLTFERGHVRNGAVDSLIDGTAVRLTSGST